MKKTSLMFLGTLALCTSLLACSPATSSSQPSSSSEPSSSETPSYTEDEIIQKALGSVKCSSYKVKLEEELTIKYPNDKYAVDIYQKHEVDLGYYYSEDEEVAHSQIIKGTFADFIKNSDELNENTLKIKEGVLSHYYKDNETGYAYVEKVNIYNKVDKLLVAIQDLDTGEFIPVVYEEQFLNPFDYITAEQLTYVDNQTILLDSEIAQAVLYAYNLVGINTIETATIRLDESYRPAALECVIPDATNGSYVRTNKVSVNFYGYDEAVFKHVTPYTNNNEDLAEAFAKYEGLVNYTYTKEVEMDGFVDDRIEGYITLDTVYFHHGYLEDGEPYIFGDDYDYKCLLNEEGIYDVYELTYDEGDTYSWKQIYPTPETPYTIATLAEIGPTFYNLSPNIFKSIGNNQYVCEEELTPIIGQYFDFGVLAVESYILESMTKSCIITLDDANNIVNVKVSASFQAIEYVFTYFFSNIGKTIIPSWMDNVNS